MAENFNLIFGSQAPTTASWSDADYQTGWNVVGSTPPTAEQFDALQNRADKKAQELNNRMLPLEQKAEEQGRQASTAYTVGAAVTVDGLPADWLLVCTTAGTSGTVAITLPNPLLDGATINDGTITWTLRKIATNGSLGYRQPSTAYTAGQIAYHASLPTGWYLECTTAGTTGSGDLTISSPVFGGTVNDGTVTWEIRINNNVARSIAFNGDVNDLTDNSLYYVTPSATNTPATGYYSIFVMTVGDMIRQIAFNNDGFSWYRTKVGSNPWLPWRQYEAIIAETIDVNSYIKYASGLALQWGESLANTLITLPISFASANSYQVVAIKNDLTYEPCSVLTSSSSQFTINAAASNSYFRWIAIGI